MNTRMLSLRNNDERYYAINYKNTDVFYIFFCDDLIGQVSSLEEAKQLATGHYNTLMGDYYE